MFKIKDYIFTPIDLYKAVLYLIKKAKRKDWIIFSALVLAFLFTKNYLNWQLDSSLFFIFLLAVFFWNLDSRIPIGLALICLIIVPFLLAIDEKLIVSELKGWAEQFAVWAYYFLVIGVIKQIWEFKNEKEEDKSETISEVAQNIQFRTRQGFISSAPEISNKKEKAIDEIIEKIEKDLKQGCKKTPRDRNAVKRRMIMDIIPPDNKSKK